MLAAAGIEGTGGGGGAGGAETAPGTGVLVALREAYTALLSWNRCSSSRASSSIRSNSFILATRSSRACRSLASRARNASSSGSITGSGAFMDTAATGGGGGAAACARGGGGAAGLFFSADGRGAPLGRGAGGGGAFFLPPTLGGLDGVTGVDTDGGAGDADVCTSPLSLASLALRAASRCSASFSAALAFSAASVFSLASRSSTLVSGVGVTLGAIRPSRCCLS